MQERQQMAHAQLFDAVEQLLAHRFRAADDDKAALEEILGLELAQLHLGARIVMQRLHAAPSYSRQPGIA